MFRGGACTKVGLAQRRGLYGGGVEGGQGNTRTSCLCSGTAVHQKTETCLCNPATQVIYILSEHACMRLHAQTHTRTCACTRAQTPTHTSGDWSSLSLHPQCKYIHSNPGAVRTCPPSTPPGMALHLSDPCSHSLNIHPPAPPPPLHYSTPFPTTGSKLGLPSLTYTSHHSNTTSYSQPESLNKYYPLDAQSYEFHLFNHGFYL